MSSSIDDLNQHDATGHSALHRAIICCHDYTDVERLLKAGANVNDGTNYDSDDFPVGTTPLHMACHFGDLELVRMLIEHGADVSIVDFSGTAAIHWTCYAGHVAVVDFLLFAGGVRANATDDKDGYCALSPVQSAVYENRFECIESLFAFGFELNAVWRRRTPLMHAIDRGSVDCVCLLLDLCGITDETIPETDAVSDEIKDLLDKYRKKTENERLELRLRAANRIRNKVGVRLMRFAQPAIVGICLAFSPLELPPYVLLWIVDWLPNYDRLSHLKKIRLIESVCRSIRCIKQHDS